MNYDNKLKAAERLLEVMDTLRAKCPWDREQTFESLRNNTIEETYELVDAIADHNMEGIREELGDLLLHVVFYSKLGEEAGVFDFADVANAECDKLIYRHPHVYSDIHADTPDEVLKNWEALKLRKKNRKGGILGGVPRSLPAMVKAFRIGEKASSAGFDWGRKDDIWDKVKEETLYGIDPELALERANKKFITRFSHMETEAERDGGLFTDLTPEQMEELWQKAKQAETEQATSEGK